MEMPPPISPESPAPKTSLEWYEHVWIALPIVLVFVGGAIGGACGGAAWAVNRSIFLKVQNPVLRYVFTGLVSAAAVVVWLVFVVVVLALLHKSKGQ